MAMPRRCEDCALKAPNFGLLAEGKKRWCAGCAKAHAGTQNIKRRRKCEDCARCGAWRRVLGSGGAACVRRAWLAWCAAL